MLWRYGVGQDVEQNPYGNEDTANDDQLKRVTDLFLATSLLAFGCQLVRYSLVSDVDIVDHQTVRYEDKDRCKGVSWDNDKIVIVVETGLYGEGVRIHLVVEIYPET